MNTPAHLAEARMVADAVLYEGYLLYPYRASSSKNNARWQFGVLGPPGASAAGLGEAPAMSMQALVEARDPDARFVMHLRCLQLQHRQVLDADGQEVSRLETDSATWLTWDEAVEREITHETTLTELEAGVEVPVVISGGEDVEPPLVRRRWDLDAAVRVSLVRIEGADGLHRLEVSVLNRCEGAIATKDDATRRSLLGAHVIVEADGAAFVSLLDPPDSIPGAVEAAAECHQDRCWPVLGGKAGDTDILLGLPIILYDYPEVAQESPGALFDATEIDEILMLRVLTMTEEEKAEARATDPLAREIIDRCDAMGPELLHQLHGAQRPTAPFDDVPTFSDLRDVDPPSFEKDAPWWDPAADAAVDPDTDAVHIDGVRVARGSRVRIRPHRRADAHDIFYAGQVGRVTAVLADVDGGTHVALVIADDPAADLLEETGRFLYFDPDELEPLETQREESHP